MNRFLKKSDWEYFNSDAISNSDLKLLKKSYKHYLTKEVKETPAMRFGSAYHKFILEPDTFESDVIIKDKSVKASIAKLSEENPEKTVITEADYKKIIDMKAALLDNEFAKRLIDADNLKEVIGEFEYQGENCRMKCDIIDKDAGLIVDLKTTGGEISDERALNRYIFDGEIYRQLYFYAVGAAIILGKTLMPALIMQETTAPYMVRSPIYIDQEFISLGAMEAKALINYLKNVRDGKAPESLLYESDVYIQPREWQVEKIREIEELCQTKGGNLYE